MPPNKQTVRFPVALLLALLLIVGGAFGGAALLRFLPRAPSAAVAARHRAATPSGMVYIPAGDFLQGTNDADADEDVMPQKKVFVPAFYMDTHEVTNAEYKKFRPAHTFPKGEENYPATDKTYADAEAYAKWAGKRLPSEAEWEKAARGTDGRRYPWGSEWDDQKVALRGKRPKNMPESKTPGKCLFYSRVRAVGGVPAGRSPYGCYDMAGNAWEWVAGHYPGRTDQRILRGGAAGYGARAARTYIRSIEGSGAT